MGGRIVDLTFLQPIYCRKMLLPHSSLSTGGRNAPTDAASASRYGVGLPVTRRGAGAAARSGAARPGAVGLLSAGAVPKPLGPGRPLARPANDPDGDLPAPDGRQAPHRLGVREVGARGLRLLAPAPVLSARLAPARARRIHRAQIDPAPRLAAGGRPGPGAHCHGPARAPFPSTRSAVRLDGRRSRYPLPHRFAALCRCGAPLGPGGAPAAGAPPHDPT